ncbi:MAG TPA: hypothetical protein VLT62_19470 [Candidatus Methylomirabilis sp.]|nr:hypothetical protein [Candidatus Methylomirabilis sp.]
MEWRAAQGDKDSNVPDFPDYGLPLLNTTHVYAEIDFEMKAQALAHLEIPIPPRGGKRWREDHGLLAFLRAL